MHNAVCNLMDATGFLNVNFFISQKIPSFVGPKLKVFTQLNKIKAAVI